ncbi:hypothetical protein RJ639_014344 [Escallonia herrerae]|uniref:Uncharacterized protein n=1 Tax=Escallonia herrerae TaxID=1293975 RepID=A0AA88VFQ6_9ASTE|nr:hypothetical protein RJ639_014344 [Escallonia herrerae]
MVSSSLPLTIWSGRAGGPIGARFSAITEELVRQGIGGMEGRKRFMQTLEAFTSIPLPSNVNHLALLPLLLPQLRHRNPQHPIFKTCPDLLQIRISRQPELPPELAARPLRPVPLVALHLLLALPLSAHPQHPVLLHLDLDLTLLHAWHVQRYHVLRRAFLPVGTRQGQGLDAFWDGHWGLFEDSEGVFGGEHQVPDGLVGHESIGLGGHEECNHGKLARFGDHEKGSQITVAAGNMGNVGPEC